MQPRSAALLEDVVTACASIGRFVSHCDDRRFAADELIRSAVERQLLIVGEAVAQLTRLDAATAARLPDRRAIIGLRNILAHAYAQVDHGVIWDIVQNDVPKLAAAAQDLLKTAPPG